MDLPFLNRRKMLMGLAAASSAAALPVAALAAADALPVVAENPELIRLGDLMPTAIAEYYGSVARLHAVIDRWQPEWPSAPAEAVASWSSRGDWEQTIDGHGMLPDRSAYVFNFNAKPGGPRQKEPRSLLKASDLEDWVERAERALRRRRPKHPLTPAQVDQHKREIADLSARLAVVRAYEAEKARVLEASGYRAARDDHAAHRTELLGLINVVMETPAETMTGVVVKAQAMSILADAHIRSWGFDGLLDGKWVTSFAASILTIGAAQDA